MAQPAPPSLKHGLLALWLAIFAVAAVLAWLVFALSRQGADAQLRRGTLQVVASCEALTAGLTQARRLRLDQPAPASSDGGRGARQAALDAVADLALRDQPGVEGGFWQAGAGVIAYAFPTYDGTGIKRDVPQAELQRIESIAARADAGRSALSELRPGLRESVVLAACPLAEGDPGAPAGTPVGWTMKRIATVTGSSVDDMVLALGLLLAFVLLSGGWLGWTLTRWSRGLRVLEDALTADPAPRAGALVPEPPGLVELDRVADALNEHARRLAEARSESERLVGELARAERLAALGRLSAGLAHEIRNPLGTMRLKAENALAAPAGLRGARADGALQAVLMQTARLEALVTSLLALTQPFHVVRRPVALVAWLDERLRQHGEAAAAARGIELRLAVDAGLAGVAAPLFDPEQLGRALDNLLLNALAHAADGGCIALSARGTPGDALWLQVTDDGPGVAAELRERLFEPFTTGRVDGTGLGLALVREIAQAHGGQARLLPPAAGAPGACFEIELPWPAS